MKCIDNDFKGNGIFIINNKKIFVPGILKDEDVELVKNKHYELVKIIKPSEERQNVICPSFYYCGGCQYLHLKYEKEIELKTKYINTLFNKNNIKITAMANPLGYRNKIQYAIENKKGLSTGFYKEGTHDFIKINKCYLHNDVLDQIASYLKNILIKYKIPAYDNNTNKGIVKHILLKGNKDMSEILVTLVLNTYVLPKRKDIVKELLNKYPSVKTIIENYNLRNTSIILGEENKVIYGTGFIKDEILNNKFLVGSDTFYQINHDGVEKLYAKALSALKLNKNMTLVDAYSGVGTLGILASSSVKNVISIELNKNSTYIAKQNAKLNKINNINFIAGDASKVIYDLACKKIKIDALIMDPPRSGSTKAFIKSVGFLKIKQVLYISCEPETLKRDLEEFKNSGYEVSSIECVDMFPRTFNIETVVSLSYNETGQLSKKN